MCCDFADAQTLTTQEVLRIPQEKADRRIAYGSGPHQFGELRMPDSHPVKTGLGGPPDAKLPVAIVIHGGCWMAAYDLAYLGNMSAALAKAGMAAWTIEYRRVGDAGGGWPGTFQDVAEGADYVRALAKEYPLDLKRVITVGHSAGGHLALWLAARHKLAKSSELYTAAPINLRGALALAPLGDLAQAGTGTGCGDMGYQLMGGKPEAFAERYQQGSPAEMLPLGVRQVLVHGEADQLVPHKLSVEYEARARKGGDEVTLISVPRAGHFELVVPTTEAWKVVENAVLDLVK
jgi:acetyl esterase/lipase